MDDPATPEAQTLTWINRVVIGENLCPFAREAQAKTRVLVTTIAQLESQIEHVLTVLTQPDRSVNNVLLVIPKGLEVFDDFWTVCETLEENLEASGLLPYVQLAHFHPEYCFDELEPNDRSNWTNRSPLPVLHFLCAQTVENRIESFSEPESIPERNIKHLRQLSESEFQKRFCKLS